MGRLLQEELAATEHNLPESVDEALCFGWIDGILQGVDDLRYTIRFTPRRPGSIWSAVNIKRTRVDA
jgi:uncharacterized protein YdeI (YjbR/CyaY-like superfamily)